MKLWKYLVVSLSVSAYAFEGLKNEDPRIVASEAEHPVRLKIPKFPDSVDAINEVVSDTLANAKRLGDEVATTSPDALSFESVLGKLEQSDVQISDAYGLLAIVANTSTDSTLREAADMAIATLSKELLPVSYTHLTLPTIA